MIAGTAIAVITLSGLLVGFLVKKPAQRWLGDAVTLALKPVMTEVSALREGITGATAAALHTKLEHAAHHAAIETRYSDALVELRDDLKNFELRLTDLERSLR